jgi:hypothetical protein
LVRQFHKVCCCLRIFPAIKDSLWSNFAFNHNCACFYTGSLNRGLNRLILNCTIFRFLNLLPISAKSDPQVNLILPGGSIFFWGSVRFPWSIFLTKKGIPLIGTPANPSFPHLGPSYMDRSRGPQLGTAV